MNKVKKTVALAVASLMLSTGVKAQMPERKYASVTIETSQNEFFIPKKTSVKQRLLEKKGPIDIKWRSLCDCVDTSYLLDAIIANKEEKE